MDNAEHIERNEENIEITKVEQEYGADEIQVLEGLEAVRKRPGMYIATTSSRGLHHLVWEIVDNAIDEALAGYADRVSVKILKDNIIEFRNLCGCVALWDIPNSDKSKCALKRNLLP